MSAFKALKALIRTRSRQFTRDYLSIGSVPPSGTEALVEWWSGDRRPLHYRVGTSDANIAYDVLFKPGRKSEYWLPPELEARRILDIGGNIGVTARYLAHLFPNAVIDAFEPIPDNYRMLARNAEGTKIRPHPYGLGARSGTFQFRGEEANRGFYSFARSGHPGDVMVEAQVRSVGEALAELGDGPIDVIKIDVEGAEGEIIDAIPDEVLARTIWIYGELHSERLDPRLAFGVLERLAGWFDIEVHKRLRKRNWFFDACNRSASERFRGFRRR